MAYKEGDKVFVPIDQYGEIGFYHTLTKEEAENRNRMAELFDKWAKELEELIKGDK